MQFSECLQCSECVYSVGMEGQEQASGKWKRKRMFAERAARMRASKQQRLGEEESGGSAAREDAVVSDEAGPSTCRAEETISDEEARAGK